MWSVGGDLVLTANMLVAAAREEVQQHAHLNRCFRSVSSKPSQTHNLYHFSRSEEQEEEEEHYWFSSGDIYKLIFGFLVLMIMSVVTLKCSESRVYKLLSVLSVPTHLFDPGHRLSVIGPPSAPPTPGWQTGSDLTGPVPPASHVYWCPQSRQQPQGLVRKATKTQSDLGLLANMIRV